MSATNRVELLPRGEIVDIRWGDQRDRRWLRRHVPPRVWSEMKQMPQWLRREMSVYRCAGCGTFGALEGVGEDTLLLWTLKERLCNACSGCPCEDCQATRAET